MGIRLGFRLAPHVWATVPLRYHRMASRPAGRLPIALAVGGGVAIVFMAVQPITMLSLWLGAAAFLVTKNYGR
jgi:3-polyprenyl-4-hydroxybenzoate decarboxylase